MSHSLISQLVKRVFGFQSVNFCSRVKMSGPLVTVKQGKLKGSVKKLLDGTHYYSFKGIPYAKPPLGNLRFAAPQPPVPWQGIYDATEHRSVCPQYDLFGRNLIETEEDCLFLNVYTKSIRSDAEIPVMVYIHGGGFMAGSGDTDSGLGPEFLLQHDVILVTLNYRLEVLGFLCLDTPEVPGNAGMKDQVAALRWVQDNIRQFGGNPDNVTLFGESAGGASVVYHMQSPMSKGLFHKAIAQSGVSIVDWAQGKDSKERAFRAAKVLGKETNNTDELLQYLRSVSAHKLSAITFKTAVEDEKRRGLPIHFAPVVEKRFDNVEAFLTDEPIDLLLENKMSNVPLMLGYNSSEGIMTLRDQMKKLEFYNKNLQFHVPREIAERVTTDRLKEIGERIKKFYVGNKEFSNDNALELVKLLTDIHFLYNTHRFAHFYSQNCKSVYMYRFSLDTDLNIVKSTMGYPDLKGACHADDLFYLFFSGVIESQYKESKRLQDIVFRVTKLWTDFAKVSNPTPEGSNVLWPTYSSKSRVLLDIDETFTVRPPELDRIEFWNKLYCEAGLPCITNSHL